VVSLTLKKPSSLSKALEALPGRREQSELKAFKGRMAVWVRKGSKDPKEIWVDRKEPQELREPQARKVRQGHKAQLAHRAM
jgi:hypothetical protein